jgi:hypothetical protein
LGTSFTAIQRYAIQKTSQAYLKHTQAHPNPLPPAPRLRGMQKLTLLSSEPPQRSRLRRRASSPERRRLQPSRPEYALSRLQPQDVRVVTTPPWGWNCETCGITYVIRPEHSLENFPLNLHSVLGDSRVYGCDCDFVPKLTKGSRQHLSAFLLGPGIRLAALLDKSHPSCKIFQTTRQSR